MYKLKDLMLVPPGGWRWTCAQHGTRLQAENFGLLLARVNGYFRANGIEVPGDRVAWLQNDLCIQHGWGSETCYQTTSLD
jgi:hypothetical protein